MYYLFVILSVILFGCDNSTKSQDIHGCLDSQACNYNADANIDNNSCWSEEDTGCSCEYGEDPSIVEDCALILNSEQEECEIEYFEECYPEFEEECWEECTEWTNNGYYDECTQWDYFCDYVEIGYYCDTWEELVCATVPVFTILEVDYCGEECPAEGDCEIGGLVEDCSDDDCCPEIWIYDGYCDDEKQLYGCDLSCYDDEADDCSDTVNSNPPLKNKVYKF